MFRKLLLLTAVLIFGILAAGPFIVPERTLAVVTEFGQPVKIILARAYSDQEKADAIKDIQTDYPGVVVEFGPGLYWKNWKRPFMQKVITFDGRLQMYVAQPKDMVTRDKQKLLVDDYAIWRIENPQRFFVKVRDEQGALLRLDDSIYSIVRDKLSKHDMPQIVRSTIGKKIESAEDSAIPAITSGGRDNILKEITANSNIQANHIGVRILDVRLRKADLPEENKEAVFNRMIEERKRISIKYRAAGTETSDRTKAQTDQQVQILLAEANRDAQTIQGEADAKAAKVYNDTFSGQKDFYTFIKTLETLEKSIKSDTTLIVNPTDSIFKLLKSVQ